MTRYDVTVRGAGIFGLSVAWSCIKRGARVQVIDPNGPGAGASGGIVGALSPHVPENWNEKKAFQLKSLLMAQAYWQEVKDASDQDAGYARHGRLQPIADDAALALAHRRAETARELWSDHATWEVVAASGAPWAPASPSGWLIHDTLSARIHPRRAVAALVAAVEAKGGHVAAEGKDEGQVLWATGTEGLADLSPPGSGIKGQAALLDFDARNQPQLFAEALHIIPHADGTTAIGSTSERDWSHDGTDTQLDDVIARARAALPVLADVPVIERWAGIRPRSRSRAPVLGAHPARPGAFIANGGFKIGFGMAPLVGEVMADLMLTGMDSIPDDFRA